MFGREPTLILAFVRALLVMGIAFGLQLSDAQFVGLYAVVETALALVNRSQVSPVEPNIDSGARRL